MVQLVCQLCIAILFTIGLFSTIHGNIEGKPAKPPLGYAGVVETLVQTAIVAWLYYFAGTFSQILP